MDTIQKLDIENNWKKNWTGIILNEDGSINLKELKKELYDYSNLIHRMIELTDYISNGLLSKPTYTVELLKSQIDDNIRKSQEEFRKDIIGILKSHDVDKKIIHEINNL